MQKMRSLLLLALALPAVLLAKVPDNEDILAKTLDGASRYYHPNLMIRYQAGDTTMTADDYHYLYYGFAYTDQYRPLETNEAFDRTLMAASMVDPDQPTQESLETLIIVAGEALDKNPFSPQLLNLMAFAYGALGNTMQETAFYERLKRVQQTIAESGDALSEKSPQHILMFDHATDVLTSRGVNYGKPKVVSRTVEFIPTYDETRINNKKIKGYFFDYSRIYWTKPENYKYERPKTWQFNNLKPQSY